MLASVCFQASRSDPAVAGPYARCVMVSVRRARWRDVERDLFASVARGVTERDGVYTFFDPGYPLVALRDLPVARKYRLIYRQDWFDTEDWARRGDAPRVRHLRFPNAS